MPVVMPMGESACGYVFPQRTTDKTQTTNKQEKRRGIDQPMKKGKIVPKNGKEEVGR
jgi:hypothetical protein